MATLTDVVAAVVVHSSAVAFSHFGVTLDGPVADKPPVPAAAERVVARSPRKPQKISAVKASAPDCPDRSLVSKA